MTVYKLLIVISISLLSKNLFSQIRTKEYSDAESFFLSEKYNLALPLYLSNLKSYSSDPELNFKIGICYLNSRSQKIKALPFLETAVTIKSQEKSNAPGNLSLMYKHLGDAYLATYNFEKASKSFEKLKEIIQQSPNSDKILKEEIEWKIEMCKLGTSLKEHLNIELQNDNKADYSSGLINNQPSLTVTFQKNIDSSTAINQDQKFFEKTIITGSSAINSQIIDTVSTTGSEATIATSVDGQIILTYKNENGDANLYVTKLKGNQWTTSEKLSKVVNNKGWETNECISADGNTLYFSSDREGGYGGRDIYKCEKIYNGEWGKAVNLGPYVNSPYNDEAPYIYPDGVTLFYSSNKYKPKGYDTFKSTLLKNGDWTESAIVGYPIKSAEETSYVAAIGNSSYSNSKEKPVNATGNSVITFTNEKRSSFILISGEITDTKGKILPNSKVKLIDNEKEELLSVTYSDKTTGKYFFIIPGGKKNINIIYDQKGYLYNSKNIDLLNENNYYEMHESTRLSSIVTGEKTILNNIFFEEGKATLTSTSNAELNQLYNFLAENKNLTVEIASYIYTNDNSKQNQQLSQERSNSIVNYLLQRGIKKESLVAKGYRKKALKNTNDKPNPQRSNQKIELKISKINNHKTKTNDSN